MGRERKHRQVNLRKRRVTTLTGFTEGDRLKAAWNHAKREWELLIESANGLRIDHSRLTLPSEAA
jgi:hypothetical protein